MSGRLQASKRGDAVDHGQSDASDAGKLKVSFRGDTGVLKHDGVFGRAGNLVGERFGLLPQCRARQVPGQAMAMGVLARALFTGSGTGTGAFGRVAAVGRPQLHHFDRRRCVPV